jgi:hypothetical protein
MEHERSLRGPAYLRVSLFVVPMAGEGWQLTNELPAGVQLETGTRVSILPAGSRVRVERIALPSVRNALRRPEGPLRDRPWVYLTAESLPKTPLVLALSPRLASRPQLRWALDVYLSRDDPAPRLEAFSEPVQEAIRKKQAFTDMPAEALEAAWGPPDTREFAFQASERVEIWTYAGGQRRAYLRDGRLERFDL